LGRIFPRSDEVDRIPGADVVLGMILQQIRGLIHEVVRERNDRERWLRQIAPERSDNTAMLPQVVRAERCMALITGVLRERGDHLRLDEAGDDEAAPTIEAACDLSHPAGTRAFVQIPLREGARIKEEWHVASRE